MRRQPWILLGILMLGALTRGLYFWYSRESPFFEPLLLDPKYYHDWALRIVHGVGEKGAFYGLPLYPYFVAFIYALFGIHALIAVKLAQVCLGVLTLYGIYRLGREIDSEETALLAALYAAFYGPLIFHEAMLIPEALGIPLYTFALFALCRLESGRRRAWAVAAGFLLGLSALTKAPALAFAVLYAAYGWIRNRWSRRDLFVWLLAATLMPLVPVFVHNGLKAGSWTSLTSHGGYNLYVGNNPSAEGVFMPVDGAGSNVDSQIEDSRAIAEAASGRTLTDTEVSRYWSGRAWAFIGAQPLKFLELAGRKIILFFDSREISDIEDYSLAHEFNPMMKIKWLTFAVIGPFAILGLFWGIGRSPRRALIAAWVGVYVLSMTLFFVNARYRLPLVPVFLILASVAVFRGMNAIRDRSWRSLTGAVLIFVAAVFVTQAHLVGTTHARDWVGAGDAFQLKGKPERALELYARAIQAEPTYAKGYLASGVVLEKLGRWEDAGEFYKKALEFEPDEPQALNNLGYWLFRRKNPVDAIENFQKAIRVKPTYAVAYNNLGMVYGEAGQYSEAEDAFRQALRLKPDFARAWLNLGLVHYRRGDTREAIAAWEKALEADPGFGEARRVLEMARRNS